MVIQCIRLHQMDLVLHLLSSHTTYSLLTPIYSPLTPIYSPLTPLTLFSHPLILLSHLITLLSYRLTLLSHPLTLLSHHLLSSHTTYSPLTPTFLSHPLTQSPHLTPIYLCNKTSICSSIHPHNHTPSH